MSIKKCVYTKKEKMVIKSENYKEILEFLNQFDKVSNVKIWYDTIEYLSCVGVKKGYTCEINLKEECYNGW